MCSVAGEGQAGAEGGALGVPRLPAWRPLFGSLWTNTPQSPPTSCATIFSFWRFLRVPSDVLDFILSPIPLVF